MATKFIELFFGQSGTGKSEGAAAIIKRVYEETGKTARVLIGDGSGATYEALQEAGIVEMADYTIRDWPLSTMKLFCEGQWPEDPLDPKSKFVPMTPAKFASIGVYVIEGLAVAGNYIMGDKKGGFAERGGRGEKIGQDSPVQIVDQDRNAAGQLVAGSGPGTVFGGNPLAHFQHGQKRMLGFIESSKGLPGWVIWTSHERMSEDKSGQKFFGPEVIGGALTPTISRSFNNTLHFCTVEKTGKQKDDHIGKDVSYVDAEYRIYTRSHFRPEGGTFVKFQAVTRHPDPSGELYGKATAQPEYFTANAPGKALIAFYENIKQARLAQIAALKSPIVVEKAA